MKNLRIEAYLAYGIGLSVKEYDELLEQKILYFDKNIDRTNGKEVYSYKLVLKKGVVRYYDMYMVKGKLCHVKVEGVRVI
jgi:hypothetical protein